MAVTYTKKDQGKTISTGTGSPSHSAVAGDEYTDLTSGSHYVYTTSWNQLSTGVGGLTYFTETGSTVTPNTTVPVVTLIAKSGATNVDVAIVPKGTGAFMLDVPDGTNIGGGNKRGQQAVDLQQLRNLAPQVASGNYSFIGGGAYNISSGDASASFNYNNTASNSNSTAFGNQTVASGNASFASGSDGTTASGMGSFAANAGTVASGGRSAAFGLYSVSSGWNTFSHGTFSNSFGVRDIYAHGTYGWATGDSQMRRIILNGRTTDATPKSIHSGAGLVTYGSDTILVLQNQNAIRFKGTIIGKKTGTIDVAAWDIDGLIVRGANAASTTLVVSNVILIQNTPAWGTPTLAADTSNGGLQVQVTGAALTNIQWTAMIETTEVIYA